MKIDLGLTNTELYAGCEIEEVAGRLNLKTPVAEAVNIVGRNITTIVADLPVVAVRCWSQPTDNDFQPPPPTSGKRASMRRGDLGAVNLKERYS